VGVQEIQATITCRGGHTETVDIEFDPEITTYSDILELFWNNHNPTSRTSSQYMSVIFYHNDEQRILAEETMKIQQKKTVKPIQTKILPLKSFTEAEGYHQKYLLRRNPYILKMIGLDSSDKKLINSFVAARLNGYIGGFGTGRDFEAEVGKFGLKPQVEASVRNILGKNNSSVTCSMKK